MEKEQAGVGRDDGTRLLRPNFQAPTGAGILCSVNYEQDSIWQPYPVNPYSATSDDHIYIIYIYTFVASDQRINASGMEPLGWQDA